MSAKGKMAAVGLLAGLMLVSLGCHSQPRVVVVTATLPAFPATPSSLPTLPVPTATLVFEKAVTPTPTAKLPPTVKLEATKEGTAEEEEESVWEVDAGYPPLP